MSQVETLTKVREKLVDMRRRMATGMSGSAGISANEVANLRTVQEAIEVVDRAIADEQNIAKGR